MASPSEIGGGDKYRSYIVGEAEKNTQWRNGSLPNYDAVNKLFEEGRTKEWSLGSLEEKVQRLVKTFEMEMVHKPRPEDRKSMDSDKFRFSLNGRAGQSLQELQQIGGSYNAFLQTALPEEHRIFNPAKETSDSAMAHFKTTFPRGFALEVLEVYSGPPKIAYKFRHWGFMEGPFKGHAPTSEKVEFYGMGLFQVNEDMKIEKAEIFYDRGELLGGLVKGEAAEKTTDGCPFLKNVKN